MPAGLGWHPRFVLREDSQLDFDASGCWSLDEDKLPQQLLAATGLHGRIDRTQGDQCFEGWRGIARLQVPSLRVQLRSSLTCLVVFVDQAHQTLTLAPVSQVSNAVQAAPTSGLGLRQLKPGETMTVQMNIQVEGVT